MDKDNSFDEFLYKYTKYAIKSQFPNDYEEMVSPIIEDSRYETNLEFKTKYDQLIAAHGNPRAWTSAINEIIAIPLGYPPLEGKVEFLSYSSNQYLLTNYSQFLFRAQQLYEQINDKDYVPESALHLLEIDPYEIDSYEIDFDPIITPFIERVVQAIRDIDKSRDNVIAFRNARDRLELILGERDLRGLTHEV